MDIDIAAVYYIMLLAKNSVKYWREFNIATYIDLLFGVHKR